MNIIIKTEDDIQKIRHAISIWKLVKEEITKNCVEGVSLLELNDIAKDIIIKSGCTPTFFGKYGFSKDICISVNECVIHGVPSNYKLKNKDLVSFDIGVTYMNHVCDAAFAVIVGQNEEANRIKTVCENSLFEVKKIIKPGITNMEIAKFIQNYIESNGYFLLEDFTGHGCGNELHEDPPFPNYYDPRFPVVKLKENMVFCLEPMILTDSNDYFIANNGWDVIAKNKKITCHVEHMFLVTKDGCEMLTQDEYK